MRVSRVQTRPSNEVKKKPSARSATGPSFSDHLNKVTGTGADVDEVTSVTATSAPSGVLAAQETPAEDEKNARRRTLERGEDILDQLDEIRHDLLMGAIPKDRLTRLTRLLEARRATVTDPRLIAVLDEIELRAKVEIAKYSRPL